MEGYSVKIREASRELTAKEKIALKDYSNATPLDTALDDVDVLTISPVAYVILDERRRGGVPSGVPARRRRCARAARREGRCVRLAYDERLACQLHNNSIAAYRLDKTVVFFGGEVG